MKKSTWYWLGALLIIILALRLTLAFSIPNLTYDSYFHLRQVEHITNTGIPLYQDPLSYGGRELTFLPLFHYIAAIFALVIPLELVAKILPNLFIITLIPIIYIISKEITENENAALFAAGVAGFLPILFTPNIFTPFTLFLPLLFLSIHSFLHIEKKTHIYLYLLFFLLLSLTSTATVLLLVGFGIYLLLSFVEGKKISPPEVELILFSIFFFTWSQFVFFKKTILEQGIKIVWLNIPSQIVQQYFPSISLGHALVLVSIVPFLAGIMVTYRSIFTLKNAKTFLLISFIISTTILAGFKLIEFNLALSFTAIILAIFFSLFYHDLYEYIKKTKYPFAEKWFALIFGLLLVATIIPPAISVAYSQQTPSDEEISSFIWLRNNTPGDSTVLALLEEGHLVTFYGQRKNIMDSQFQLVTDVDRRFADLNSLFSTPFQTQALSLFDQHNVEYLVLTPTAMKKYNLPTFKYISGDCFQRARKSETKIYHVTCGLARAS